MGSLPGEHRETASWDEALDGTPISDAELEELALGADPEAPLDEDAVPMATFLGQGPGLLPQWYMPSPLVRSGARWRVPVVLVIVAAFVVIEALGLCSTFGQLVPA
ncbi:MAG: hypothetical protein WB565_13505 [Acidimicrobiales bacterium]